MNGIEDEKKQQESMMEQNSVVGHFDELPLETAVGGHQDNGEAVFAEEEVIPVQMAAVVYNGPGQPLSYRVDVQAPSEIPPGHVLVQITAAALCRKDLYLEDGTINFGVAPIILGHEGVGIILSVGVGVDESRLGQRVIIYYHVGCGDCRWCRQGDEHLCSDMKAEYGFLNNGTLANYIVVPSRNAVAIPSTISNVQAAPIACSIATAVHAAKLAQVKEGDWCVIYGVNGIGLSLVQLLKREYGAKVMAIARDPVRRKRALELGADGFVDSLYASEVANLARAIIPDGADVVFECVGRRETLDACVGWQGILGRRGKLILIGYASGEEHDFVCHPLPLIVKEQSVIGSCGATLEDVNEAIQYVSNGVIETTVDSQVPMENFQNALDRIENCECTGKIVYMYTMKRI